MLCLDNEYTTWTFTDNACRHKACRGQRPCMQTQVCHCQKQCRYKACHCQRHCMQTQLCHCQRHCRHKACHCQRQCRHNVCHCPGPGTHYRPRAACGSSSSDGISLLLNTTTLFWGITSPNRKKHTRGQFITDRKLATEKMQHKLVQPQRLFTLWYNT